MNDLPGALDQITTRLSVLERRVSALEHPAEQPVTPTLAPSVSQPAQPPVANASGAFSILGRALLGIAGAYLLRALEESGSLPRLPIVWLALLYAFLWLAFAAHVRDRGWSASITYACTSALILAPMLWELTLRFTVFPASLTAAVLAAYAVLASLIARGRPAVIAVAHIACACVALALAAAAPSQIPFLLLILLLVGLNEAAALRDHPTAARIPVALIADLSIWLLVYLTMTSPGAGTASGFLSRAALLLPGFVLFALAAAATALRTLAQHRVITAFDVCQTTLTFFLAAVAWRAFGPPAAPFVFGCFCLVLSIAAYAAFLSRAGSAAGWRTLRVYAAWSAILLLVGGWLALPAPALTVLLSMLAVGALLLSIRRSDALLHIHAILFLLAAAIASSLPAYVYHAFAAFPSAAPSWSLWTVALAAAYCSSAGLQNTSGRAHLIVRILATLLVLGFATAAAVSGLVALLALNLPPQAHHLAFIRTLILCAAAALLAYTGARWPRVELTRISYAVLALLTVKLLLEDLRHGHLVYLAASIFLFALTLIAVPRISRPAGMRSLPD